MPRTPRAVHRDLKSANVFLTKRGQLKVLDFGLAKMTDPVFDAAAATSPALTADLPSPLTSPGLAVGTIAFMSPEQARGADLDARSDLFSVGTMLYQMATGHLPFEGKTTAVIFDGILNREPAPLSDFRDDLPVELQRIIGKCLEKDPDLRYQHASELRADLRRLTRDSVKSVWGQSPSQMHFSETTPARHSPSAPPMPLSSGKGRAFVNSEIVVAASQHRIGFAFGSVIAFTLAAAAFGMYELLHRPARIPFQNMAITSLTSGGDSEAAAMSADGKYLAMLQRETDGRDSLWMRHLATNSNAQIVPPGDAAIRDVTFGPDGDYVYLRSTPSGSSTSDLHRVPILGGPPAFVVHDIDSTPAFSASSGRFCFMRYKESENTQSLISANADGSNEKIVYSGKGLTYRNPAWSPDGKRIVVEAERKDGLFEIAMIDAVTGTVSIFCRLPKPDFDPIHFAWMPGGHGLIVVYRVMSLGLEQVAFLSYPSGEFHQITNDLNLYGTVSVGGDGKTISTVLSSLDYSVDVFSADGRNLTESAALSLGSAYWLDWANDDELVVTRGDNLGVQLLSIGSSQWTTLYSGTDLRIVDLDICGPIEYCII